MYYNPNTQLTANAKFHAIDLPIQLVSKPRLLKIEIILFSLSDCSIFGDFADVSIYGIDSRVDVSELLAFLKSTKFFLP